MIRLEPGWTTIQLPASRTDGARTRSLKQQPNHTRTAAMAKHSRTSLIALGSLIGAILAPSGAAAQPVDAPGQTPASNALTQNFLAEHEIGRRFHIDPADLPAPKTGPIVTNRSLIVPYDGQVPQVPPGFTATPFATGLDNPRRLLVLPNGDVLVAEQRVGYLTLLRDDGEGRARWIDRHAEDLNRPDGLAWRRDHVLVADQDGIWQVPHILGALRAGRSEQKRVDQVPPNERKPVAGAYGAQMITQKGVFGIVQGHQNRHLAVEPTTGALFVGVGSSGNLGIEPEPKATIQRFDADGSNQTTVASGMRNPTALAFHPHTGELYALVQERDGLGDRLPSDYLRASSRAGSTAGPMPTSANTRTPASRAWHPKRSTRRSHPTSCSRPIRRSWTSYSMKRTSFRRNT